MPTLRVIYDADGWAFHRRADALRKYAPPDFDVTIARFAGAGELDAALGDTPPDVILLLRESQTQIFREELRRRAWPSKLVGAWSAGWPLRLPGFYATRRAADAVVINNSTAWKRVGRLRNTFMIPNGVDLDVFRIQTPPEARMRKVLWVGSELGRKRKGYDSLILPLKQQLERRGIVLDALLVDSHAADKKTAEQMAEWYNGGMVLVCASDTEGTPNPALEAAACGCTVVSTRVGNMPELIEHGVNGYLVDREPRALLDAVEAACRNYLELSRAMQATIQSWSWRTRSQDLFAVFRSVLEPDRISREIRPDLRSEVTVFVTTVGAPSFESCMEHLHEQDSRFEYRIIEGVAPMSAAFQRMLDECATPYYVQVDEDMLLYPHAVRSLHGAISTADSKVALVVGYLLDVHLGSPIQGVKIFRHDVVKRYPLQSVQSFEKVQLRQLKADGYAVQSRFAAIDEVIGLHGTHWTPESIYERYATLERRRRGHPVDLQWFEAYPPVFLKRFLEDPSELNLFALMGVMAGALASERGDRTDKDHRRYGSLPGLASVREFLAELTAGRGTER